MDDDISTHEFSNGLTTVADAHMHLFTRGYHRRADAGSDSDVFRYQRLREEHDIRAALVIGYEAEGIDPDNNVYLRLLAAERPWMTTVAFLPVGPAPTPRHLEDLFDAGHRGIALHCLDAASAETVATWPGECWRVGDTWRVVPR